MQNKSDIPFFEVGRGGDLVEKYGLKPETIRLDPARVPEPLRTWIPLAERWGQGDDVIRERMVNQATPAELEGLLALAEADEAEWSVLWAWLAGPEADSKRPTAEYVAFTCLAMAYDSARVTRKRELARELYQACHLPGSFTLRSGQTATEYFDKYRFEAQPRLLKPVAKAMTGLIPAGTDVLAGLELGGIAVATAMSLYSGLPVVFVRKKAKPYGTRRLAEGLSSLQGLNTCIVEDVITTGGQAIASAKDLRDLGAIVRNVVCVIARRPQAREALQAEWLQLTALFTQADLEGAAG